MTDRSEGRSLEELEREVPDVWVASMWDDVRRELRNRRRSGRGRWAVYGLAAAVVALLFAQGLTLRTVGRVEARSEALTTQLVEQQRRLVEVEEAAVSGGSRAASASRREVWLRELGARGGDMTVADLRDLLRELPAGTTLVRVGRASALRDVRFVPTTWRAAAEQVGRGGELTAADVLELLDALDLPAGATLPTERLIDLIG